MSDGAVNDLGAKGRRVRPVALAVAAVVVLAVVVGQLATRSFGGVQVSRT